MMVLLLMILNNTLFLCFFSFVRFSSSFFFLSSFSLILFFYLYFGSTWIVFCFCSSRFNPRWHFPLASFNFFTDCGGGGDTCYKILMQTKYCLLWTCSIYCYRYTFPSKVWLTTCPFSITKFIGLLFFCQYFSRQYLGSC